MWPAESGCHGGSQTRPGSTNSHPRTGARSACHTGRCAGAGVARQPRPGGGAAQPAGGGCGAGGSCGPAARPVRRHRGARPPWRTVGGWCLAGCCAEPRAAERAVVLVRAPWKGVHDSLWRIADRELGDGARWPEIYQLNKGRLQPDGRRLVSPSLVYPAGGCTCPPPTATPRNTGPGPRPDPQAIHRTPPGPATEPSHPHADQTATHPNPRATGSLAVRPRPTAARARRQAKTTQASWRRSCERYD